MAELNIANELGTAIFNKIKSSIFDSIYPVGSIYLSSDTTNPSTKFGGTWIRVSGGFIYGSVITEANTNTFNTGNIGTGVNTNNHTLTVSEIPAHSHDFYNTGRNLMWDSGLDSFGGLTSGTTVQYTWDCRTKDTGGGSGHNHPIPYIACSIWRRTA